MKTALALIVALPLAALAAPPQPPAPPERPDSPMDSNMRERHEKHMRTMRVVGLSEALDLNTAEALRLDEGMRKFDERRRPLREQVEESARLLKRAADGDTSALGQVDQAALRILDARAQIAAMDKEMFTALSRDLKPQQRARMAIFLAKFEREAMRGANKMMRMNMPRRQMGGGGGPGGPHGQHWGQMGEDSERDD